MMNPVKHDLSAWLLERYRLEGLLAAAGKKMIPRHRHSFWYFLGGILLFLFLLQAITGMMLMIYYRPTAAEAHDSVTRIITGVPFGWLVRSLHAWGANLMVFTLFLHFFSTLFLKAYRKPRELTWVTGMLLLIIVLALGFSGYLLPWDELSFTATRVGTDIPRALGPPGLLISTFLRGGEDVSGETLGRFFAAHVILLPFILMLVASVHIFFVQLQGMSQPIVKGNKSGTVDELPFFPNFVYRDLAIWIAVFSLLVTMSSLFPPGLGSLADPLSPTPAGLKPEWYFLFLFQTIKIFPAKLFFISGETLAVALITASVSFFLLLPFLDRRSSREEKSPAFTTAAAAAMLYFIVMTMWGFLS